MPSLSLHAVAILQVGPVTLKVESGECVVLRGPSGAGKSLLLRALADLSPHSGEVLLGDAAQSRMRGPQWRGRVGYLPSESGWWAATVGEHFADRVDCAAVGLPAEAMDWEVARLSTGERQRLSLLRLLAGRPRALLLDEPTANLDADGTTMVEELVSAYRSEHGAPVLWVAHDRTQGERIAARRFVLDAGRVEAEPA